MEMASPPILLQLQLAGSIKTVAKYLRSTVRSSLIRDASMAEKRNESGSSSSQTSHFLWRLV
jgi:hypothetical protein